MSVLPAYYLTCPIIRLTTGGSIIFDPRLTTPSPSSSAMRKAFTTAHAFATSSSVGRNASWTTAICRVDTALPLEAEAARFTHRCSESGRVRDVGVDRVDGLQPCSPRRVHDHLARVARLVPLGRALHAQVRCVVLEADGESDVAFARCGDGECVHHALGRLDDRHEQERRICQLADARVDSAELPRLLDLRDEDEVAAVFGDEGEVVEPALTLVDPDHPLCGTEVDLTESVSDEHTRCRLGLRRR